MYQIAAVAIALFSSAAQAASVNLSCQVDPGAPTDARPATMHVTLDEDSGMATYAFVGYGPTFSEPAVFSPDKVTFGDYSIDRNSLEFYASGKHGRCSILKRAF